MRWKVIVAALLTLSVLAPIAGASGDLTAIDRDHELTGGSAVAEWESQEYVEGDVAGLNMSLAVADTISPYGESWWQYPGSGRVFLRIDYNEELSRTVRVYIPREIIRPRLKEDLEPLDDGPAATLEPTGERKYTAVTVRVDGPTEAIYPVSVSRGLISDGRSGIIGAIQNTTGIPVPSLAGSSADWKPVPDEALSGGDATYKINNSNETELSIQYDASTNGEETTWIRVRECSESDDSICRFSRDAGNATFVLSTSDDPPDVRYKQGRTATDTGRFVVDDARRAAAEALATAKSLVGWT